MLSVLLFILAILFPPLPVAMLKGFREQFIISVILTILAYFPGLLYSAWVIATSNRE